MSDPPCQPWVGLFTEVIDDQGLKGYVKSFEQMNDLIRCYEVTTATKYCAYTLSQKDFGHTSTSAKDKTQAQEKFRLRWSQKESGGLLVFDGVPFLVLNTP